MIHVYNDILRVIGIIFIEIRAASSLQQAQGLADVFHNAAACIASGSPPDKVEEDIYRRAARLNCESYVRALFDSVRDRNETK